MLDRTPREPFVGSRTRVPSLVGREGGRLMRTLAIGLDGCSWNVLEPLLESGELPNLARLREDGAHGALESTVPFFTGPAWASFATGASPAAHGIYDFMMLREDGRLTVAHQSDVRRTMYHHQLGREGKRSVLINLPLDQDGCEGAVIVNSWLTDSDTHRILPAGRRERYRRLLEAYRTFPVNPADLDELCAIEEARFDLARELFLGEPWDHFFLLFSSTDWLGHGLTGRFLRGEAGAREAFLRLYRQLDGYIGWFAARAPDATIAVLSDHGQCEEDAVVHVNAVLRDLGLATAEDPGSGERSPFFVDRRPKARVTVGIPTAVGRFRMNPLVRPLALVVKRALKRGAGIEVAVATQAVDRRSSAAFCPTDASFAVYARDCSDDDVERIREALLEIRLDDGRAAIDDVWTPEELYGRPPGGYGPALVFAPALGVRPSASLRDTVVGPPRSPGRGCHQRDGILILAGPNVPAAELSRASLYDLAPTLLWAMGAGIPEGGDGRVLVEAFEDSFAATRPIREIEAAVDGAPAGRDTESDEVARRLKALGYI
jgi:predicted AlkP superfamily phosphohydrolase/phosphomutase